MMFDPSTLVLSLQAEGKHFPQKLFYFQEGVIARKYNFYTENVTQSATSLRSDWVYTCGVKGEIARISKHDVCRHLVRSKEKLKNKQVQKVYPVDSPLSKVEET